jgi:hypothetical protein
MTEPLRILHLPDVIGGHPPALAAGECARGMAAKTLCVAPSLYGYPADIMLGQAGTSLGGVFAERWRAFQQVRSAFDVYHFNFGASLLHFPRYGAILPEMAFYRRDAARIMTWQGDDARLAYPEILDRSLREEALRGRWAGTLSHTAFVDPLRRLKRRLSIERAARTCDHMFALNPDLLASMPAGTCSFLPYAITPPVVSGVAPPDVERAARSPLRLVHLSTSPVIKGTGLIEAAVARAAKSVAVELDLVIKQPREAALQRLAAADYMIDQLVLGWYGGTVVEAMYLGVPAIGHIDPQQASAVPELASELPVLTVTADTLADRIIELALTPETRGERVRQGLAFARKWHDPRAVAALTIAAYQKALAGRR